MHTLAIPRTPRNQSFQRTWRSLSTGSQIMDREVAEILGITIDSNSGKEHTAVPLVVSPTLSQKPSDVYIESLSVAARFHDSILALSNHRRSQLSQWPDSYLTFDPYWAFTDIMTTGDQATAFAITVHSHTASDTEILTTEFAACYVVAAIAWHENSVQQDFEKRRVLAPTQQRLQRRVREDIECESKSVSRRLPIRIISIHGRNIRILDTIFTDEYYQSLGKTGQTSSSQLNVHINSFLLGYDDGNITHILEKLMMDT